MVFGYRAARASVESELSGRSDISNASLEFGAGSDGGELEAAAKCVVAIREVMNDRVGIVRNDDDLKTAMDSVGVLRLTAEELSAVPAPNPDLWETRNLATVAEIIVRSAASRKESRGLHYNLDHPKADDLNWRRDTLLRGHDVG
jgi:succinate dehydrogenase/fumarate reductase flavoprotein subunit